jgi:hypothetical protein
MVAMWMLASHPILLTVTCAYSLNSDLISKARTKAIDPPPLRPLLEACRMLICASLNAQIERDQTNAGRAG